jgi:hypothetical protein
MSTNKQMQLVLAQNSPDFELESLENQASLFKFKYLSKVLDPKHPNPVNLDNYCTIIVKYLIKGCLRLTSLDFTWLIRVIIKVLINY